MKTQGIRALPAGRDPNGQRTTSTAPPIENDTNDPPPTSQPTDDNPLTDLQDRQRAPQKQLSRCSEDRTRIELSLSEISDEADNGQKELNCSSNCSLENISSPRPSVID